MKNTKDEYPKYGVANYLCTLDIASNADEKSIIGQSGGGKTSVRMD